MTGSLSPAKNVNSRVFVIEGRARPDHAPSYESCLRMMGITQNFGDIERIENPDPYNYGKFEEIGETQGAVERATTSLEGRYAIDIKSILLRLAVKRCSVDVQLHFGQCQDPSEFNSFDKVMVLESVKLTSWNTEDMGALQSADESPINENADISAKEIYEILPISFGVKAGGIVTNELVAATLCDSASCGDCETESDGCKKIFAISLNAGGSPSTPPDVVFTIDKGTTWYAHDIDTIVGAEDPTDVACLGQYLFVVSEATESLHYALLSEFDGVTDPAFTEVATGFVAGSGPNAISTIGNLAYIVGELGYVYTTQDVTAGVSVLDAGVATISELNAVHALSSTFVVAVGNDGAIIYSENGSTFSLATNPVGVGVDLNCVWVKSESEWWVGTSGGSLYYTIDGGDTWTVKAFPGSGAGVTHDIVFATDSVAYLAHATATPAGRILRSYDGGYSWQIVPERAGATLPANDQVNALVACQYDVNFVVGVGLADDGADGYAVVGLA